MTIVSVEVTASSVTARMDAMTQDVRATLKSSLGSLAKEIAAEARAVAAAHIRLLSKEKPGTYLPSIYGGVSGRVPTRTTGYVRSGHPLAHLLEYGFTYKDQIILPNVKKALAFEGAAGKVITRRVHREELRVQAYPAIRPAFLAAESEIRATMEAAAKKAVK